MLIDTHAHLYAKEFDLDRDKMILRATAAGVGRIYLPNVDLDTIDSLKKMLALSPSLYPMMGLHPCHVKEDYQNVLEKIKLELDVYQYYGVGEIGIDMYWDKTTLDFQVEAFKIK